MAIDRPILPEQESFTMGEVSRLLRVPPHTLRYWEARIGLLKPSRRSSGHRRYSREDIETICRIREFVERRKMTMAGARKALLEERRGARAQGKDAAGGAVPSSTLKLLREIKKEIRILVEELKNS
ncbi:MAG: MerR family transcriptional regulator [Elusimicrobia bacterium]|nr:MerR family transcriptional regulator [Elusimicrobiota bacterium]